MIMKNKWIIVTGASSGIGEATARLLLQEGYKTVLTARDDEKIRSKFSSFDEDSYHIEPCDLSQIEKIKDYAKAVNEKVGRIHGLIHCAGINRVLPINVVKIDTVRSMFETNTFSAFELIKHFSKKKMYFEEGCSFVLISSLAAHEGSMGNAIYAATKGALEGFLAPGAAELVRKKIRLNIVVPGFVKTPMTESFLNKTTEEQENNLKMQYPLGFGEPSQIANMIEYLISDKSKWITGRKFFIDGGHMIRF
jgi:3-oxoacyl-[acyl-carrier protein] reductase